jgi:pimeloyl-ACP methyl ester carboxylesterase
LRLRALALVATLLLAGCASGEPEPTLAPNSNPSDQDLVWVPCDDAFECAKIAAPIDWTSDTGDFLNIKLMRSAGTAELEPILINPGGPGSSAVGWMRSNYDGIGSTWLRENFQVIAFDPRGVGESTAVVCTDEELKDEVYYGISEFEFGSAEDISYSEQALAAFAANCQQTGPNLGYFNTQQTARDMDLIRQLLGMEQLNYIGFSYGTELGAVYTALFPDHVGKFVLDGAIDPTMDSSTSLLGQVTGFDKALRAYLADCLNQSFCPFSGDVESAMAQISGFMQAREVKPLPTDGDRELGISATLAGIIVTLYSQDSWVYLTQAFSDAFTGDGTLMLWLADFYNDRDPDGGYVSNINEANYAINCADGAIQEEGPDLEAEILEASVVFGKYFAYPIDSCLGWPEGIGMQELDFSQPLSNGPLVIGTTGDPATPYEQAVSLSELLDGAKLLTLRGEGHTAYGTSSCIDSLVDAYLEGTDLGEGSLSCF